jgi:tetratricopeptide (TPR) repeat protein
MTMGAEYLKILEARAKVKLNEMRENKISDQDRMDFADYIRTLYNNHRYYHVIIAADFYRALFNEGDYPEDLGNQVVAAAGSNARQASDSTHVMIKSFGVNANVPGSMLTQFGNAMGGDTTGQSADSGQPLSIADEVTSALEINERVSQAVEVFKYKAGKGAIASASGVLQDAFIGNEFHPELKGLARDDKEKVSDFLTKVDVLKNQLEVRAFEQVEAQIADIKKVASDFDETEPMALVNDTKLASRLQLGKAQLQAQAGNLPDAMETFQTAMELWPGNPDLTTSSNLFFKSEDNQNEAAGDFDRLLKDQNYRGRRRARTATQGRS